MDQRKRRSVLVADDEASIRSMLSRAVERNDFLCAQAADGESAVVVAREDRFDVIIMDVRMPGISGIEALRAIKQDNPGQIVMMMSGTAEAETVSEAMELGASDYVTKPFSLADMLVKIEAAIARGGRDGAGTADSGSA